MRVPLIGGGDAGGGVGVGGGVCIKEEEYVQTVHYDATNSGTL